MIREVVEGCHAKLISDLEQRGRSPMPSFELGEAALATGDTFPRITWVPRSGRHDGWKSAVSADQRTNPRQLWSRLLNFEVHIWEETIEKVEELANDLVGAVHFMTGGSYQMVGEEWDTSGQSKAGVVGVFTIQIRMPFTRQELPTVKASPALQSQVVRS